MIMGALHSIDLDEFKQGPIDIHRVPYSRPNAKIVMLEYVHDCHTA
jgi:hypothetical protein